MILLDTNIVIGYLAGKEAVVNAMARAFAEHGDIALSTINVVELFAYRSLTPQEINQLEQFVEHATVFVLTQDIAARAAEVRRTYNLTTTDAVIAATALSRDIPLISQDQDFKKVPHLKLLVP